MEELRPTTAAAGPALMLRPSPYEEQYVDSNEGQVGLGVIVLCSWEAPLYHQALPHLPMTTTAWYSAMACLPPGAGCSRFQGSRQDSRGPAAYSPTSCQGPRPLVGPPGASMQHNSPPKMQPCLSTPIHRSASPMAAGRWLGICSIVLRFLEHPGMLYVLHRSAAGWAWHSSGTSSASKSQPSINGSHSPR